MDSKLVRRFAEAMTRADRSLDGARLWVTVTYNGSQEKYDEWAPLQGDDFSDEGIRDPGFGSGPVRYSDVTSLHVHPLPRPLLDRDFKPETLKAYASKYGMLANLVTDMSGVRIDTTGISIG